MAENKTMRQSGGIDLSIKIKDSRYPIKVNIDDKDEFALYFNPGDAFVLQYADNLQNLDTPDKDGDFLTFTAEIEKNLDAIFGDGAARKIFRYDNAEHTLVNALLEKVREGYADFQEKAAAAEKEAKVNALIEAKKNAAPFIPPNS